MPGEKLPEEFAASGPKLSRFPIQPAPPVRPRLFADEARFAGRLALLAGGAELAAWIWFARLLAHRGPAWAALAFAACRISRPFWGWLGTRVRRGAVAFALLAVALLVQGFAAVSFADGLGAVAAALPAVADLCAAAIADAVTVERRAAAYSWLDIAQGLGCAVGLAVGVAEPRLAPLLATAALLVGSVGVADLRDRGTPRSTWPVAVRLQVLRAPLAGQLALLAAVGGGCAAAAAVRSSWGWWSLLPPSLGMAAAARSEAAARNALIVPRALAVLGALALALRQVAPPAAVAVGLFALGGLCAALPGAAARGAGEMERPVASSLAWTALALGAGVGLACSALA
ncbi:MAG: hypothetical protein E6J64_01550 [Deltaproteobacteria bacterium]|nr:MAG: hypothetical protein E6J64_01550 [Deltaproteobacteria bacterium]